ncbi:hypothetical protein P153DRAFT_204239 [Dothidotthia symphoricarpi CBS 119687]|uniref:Uncharacterized protein n=1 Tax=Dothidotthia symphoricarpi CBS 119687 TaxID=1392245 RepID=A0A6A6AIL2_9PLEO|nr:uncharacterized protein P153DRAFT_204239 [Dothidotthia symphoricarpi CBS 119687]KAF2130744.1 hypothetical protein P153DRAFT_204239 [Dothidotthia symphoricarpi CBS 119687]
MSSPQIQDPEIFFRGGSNVLKPNHITRYQYPHPLDHGIPALRLQLPANSAKRSRPQGHGDFGIDGATFLTITRSYREPPTEADFRSWSDTETKRDAKSRNPLGRAMTRMTKYAGNTLLKSGKFAKRGGLVYVVNRVTSIPLAGDGFGKEEDTYNIPCDQWRGLKPLSTPGHDSWWQRLHVRES